MHKKILKNLIVILVICALSYISYAADSEQESTDENKNSQISNLQNQRKEIQEKVEENQEILDLINSKITENLKQIQQMDETISKNQENLNEVNKNISSLSESIKVIQKKIDSYTKKYNTQKDLLDQRLVAMYETSDTSYLDYMLTSSNLSEFISTYYLVSELTEYDTNLLETVDKEKKAIEEQKAKLDKHKEELEEKRKVQVKTQVILENSKLLRQNFLSKLSEEEKKVQEKIDEYNRQVAKIESEIISLATTASFGENYIGGKMTWPIWGHYNITSPFSMRVHPITKVYKLHTGIDISATLGTDFTAAAHGMVVKAEYNRAYGNMVIIDHGGGVQTLYAHGSSIEVQVGQIVNAGDLVIKVGSTGYSTGPHAHFEVRVNGQPVNPLQYIKVPGQEQTEKTMETGIVEN